MFSLSKISCDWLSHAVGRIVSFFWLDKVGRLKTTVILPARVTKIPHPDSEKSLFTRRLCGRALDPTHNCETDCEDRARIDAPFHEFKKAKRVALKAAGEQTELRVLGPLKVRNLTDFL